MIARVAKALNRKDGDKGFTLIELLVVVIIIGILAAIAVPQFVKQRERAFDAAVKSDLKNTALVAETNYVDALTYDREHTFRQGGVESGTAVASKGTSYAAWGDTDSYVIYGLSKSGNLFKIDSEAGNTPELVDGNELPETAPTGSGYSGASTAAWDNLG